MTSKYRFSCVWYHSHSTPNVSQPFVPRTRSFRTTDNVTSFVRMHISKSGSNDVSLPILGIDTCTHILKYSWTLYQWPFRKFVCKFASKFKNVFFNTSSTSTIKVSVVTCLSTLLSKKTLRKPRASSCGIFG